MDEARELPDAEWFRRMADGNGLVFFLLRVQPDVAFEFINDAIEAQIGVSAAEALADAESVLGRIDAGYTERLAETLALEPGQETAIEMVWRHRDGRDTASRIRVRSRRRDDGSVVLEGSARDVTQLREAELELQQSERRHRLLSENAWEVIWTMGMDTTITYVSPAVQQQRGLTPAEAMRESLAEALTPESTAIALDYFRQIFEAKENGDELPTFRGELDFYRKDGAVMSADLQVIPHVDDNGELIELLGVSRDVSERKRVEAELRKSEERSRLMAENAWEIIWTADATGTVTYVSPSVERVRGITVEQAMNQPLDEIYPPSSADSIRTYFRNLHLSIRDGTPPPTLREEHEMYRGDGTTMMAEIQVIPHLDEDGCVVEIIGVTRDISERKAFESELRRLAVTDALTGVWNRRHGEELFNAELTQARQTSRPLTLLMLDIDHFKAINDRYGHQAGDRVLIEVSRRLQANLPSTDIVARWGGEEFVILLRGSDIDEGMATAEKLRGQMADMIFVDVGPVTVSIGAAERWAGDSLDSWLARADEALYRAKRSGRNAVSS
ncbi:sensor domain-containing diguanylate cyclase [Mycobacterium sp. M26]|uniref:sensor domain-containing diguanylate cyclase n=1 Tax=Mycobacterium sp. M26 TaxID=1762962 RepID=UPI00073E79D6|nr:sensor domain-containing diguanylate cyclase [Mycobacterium sp. M26]